MHRVGADPADMQPHDFLCDFCHVAWDGTFPMVEGHRGSLICGRCLTVAFTESEVLGSETRTEPTKCTMCLEEKTGPGWTSPAHGSWVCSSCIKRAAGRLHKDPDWDWRKPVRSIP